MCMCSFQRENNWRLSSDINLFTYWYSLLVMFFLPFLCLNFQDQGTGNSPSPRALWDRLPRLCLCETEKFSPSCDRLPRLALSETKNFSFLWERLLASHFVRRKNSRLCERDSLASCFLRRKISRLCERLPRLALSETVFFLVFVRETPRLALCETEKFSPSCERLLALRFVRRKIIAFLRETPSPCVMKTFLIVMSFVMSRCHSVFTRAAHSDQ